MTAFSDLLPIVLELGAYETKRDTITDEDKAKHIETTARYNTQRDIMRARISEVHLIAPKRTRELLAQNTTAYLAAYSEFKTQKSASYVREWAANAYALRDNLFKTMRADLGETS
jgi:hypothetical protein